MEVQSVFCKEHFCCISKSLIYLSTDSVETSNFEPMKNVLVLVKRSTNRLKYVFDLVLHEQLGVPYELTTDTEVFDAYEGPRFAYGENARVGAPFQKSVALLFEREIVSQELKPTDYLGSKVIFPVFSRQSILPFDVFAAVFYLVTRYEEYLPFMRDQHGRFEANSCILEQLGLLHKPVVNHWIASFGTLLAEQLPGLEFAKKNYTFLPTYDIDAAWAYRHKGLFRSGGAYAKDLVQTNWHEIKLRTEVLRGVRKDPFDTFDIQLQLQAEFKLRPIYFILFAAYGVNDKNISVRNRHFQNLIKQLGDYADIGIHPSYASFSDKALLKTELKNLSQVLNREVTKSRQHFLRMNLPATYHNLIDLDIKDDYTMGFASRAGFRAGIADSFSFYDLDHDVPTRLRIHPFALMDGTLRDYLKLGATEAVAHAERMIKEVKAVNGTFVLLWHNESLSNQKRWAGWLTVYRKIIEMALA